MISAGKGEFIFSSDYNWVYQPHWAGPIQGNPWPTQNRVCNFVCFIYFGGFFLLFYFCLFCFVFLERRRKNRKLVLVERWSLCSGFSLLMQFSLFPLSATAAVSRSGSPGTVNAGVLVLDLPCPVVRLSLGTEIGYVPQPNCSWSGMAHFDPFANWSPNSGPAVCTWGTESTVRPRPHSTGVSVSFMTWRQVCAGTWSYAPHFLLVLWKEQNIDDLQPQY